MHIYDRDGMFNKWQRDRRRNEVINACILGAVCALGMVGFIYAVLHWR